MVREKDRARHPRMYTDEALLAKQEALCRERRPTSRASCDGWICRTSRRSAALGESAGVQAHSRGGCEVERFRRSEDGDRHGFDLKLW